MSFSRKRQVNIFRYNPNSHPQWDLIRMMLYAFGFLCVFWGDSRNTSSVYVHIYSDIWNTSQNQPYKRVSPATSGHCGSVWKHHQTMKGFYSLHCICMCFSAMLYVVCWNKPLYDCFFVLFMYTALMMGSVFHVPLGVTQTWTLLLFDLSLHRKICQITGMTTTHFILNHNNTQHCFNKKYKKKK